MRLGFDIDGCLADFNSAYGKLLIEVTGVNHFKDGWETDPEFPKTWNWELDAGYTKEQMGMVWDVILKNPKFWLNLEPMPEAKALIKELNKLARKGTDIYFLTHRMGVKAKFQTEEWLYGLGMHYPTVLLTGDKAPILHNLGVKFFVDDKLATMNDIHRQLGSKGNHYYLLNRPHNQVGREHGVRAVNSIVEALQAANVFK